MARVLTLPTPDPKCGAYFFENGCVIQPAFNVPGKFRAFWPNGVALRGDNDEVSYFDSPEEVLAIFIDAGY